MQFLAVDETYINQKNGWQIVEVLEIWANGERERERERELIIQVYKRKQWDKIHFNPISIYQFY